MFKSTHTPEFCAMVIQEYINGAGSSYYLADKYHIGRAAIQKWAALFREHEMWANNRFSDILIIKYCDLRSVPEVQFLQNHTDIIPHCSFT